MKKGIAVLLLMLILFTGCGNGENTPTEEPVQDPLFMDYGGWKERSFYTLQFSEDILISNVPSVLTTPGKVTITEGGTYLVTGELDNAQLVINAPNETVELVLSNVRMGYNRGSGIFGQNAGLLIINLDESTQNVIQTEAEELQKAAIYTNCNCVVTGKGSLMVGEGFKNGILVSKTLVVNGADVTIQSRNAGISGGERFVMQSGKLTIHSFGNGIRMSSEYAGRGNIQLCGGTVQIASCEDALYASSNIILQEGSGTFETGTEFSWMNEEKSPFATDLLSSSKGLYSGKNLNITGGTWRVNTIDSSAFSGNGFSMSGGSLTARGVGDTLRITTGFTLSGGTLRIQDGEQGIAATSLEQTGGNIFIYCDGSPISGPEVVSVRGGTMLLLGDETGTFPAFSEDSIVCRTESRYFPSGSVIAKVESMEEGTFLAEGESSRVLFSSVLLTDENSCELIWDNAYRYELKPMPISEETAETA